MKSGSICGIRCSKRNSTGHAGNGSASCGISCRGDDCRNVGCQLSS